MSHTPEQVNELDAILAIAWLCLFILSVLARHADNGCDTDDTYHRDQRRRREEDDMRRAEEWARKTGKR